MVDALAKKGITITVGYVRTIKAKHNTRRRAVKKVVAAVAPKGVGIPEIKAAFAFLKAVGSVAVAKQALTAAVESRPSCRGGLRLVATPCKTESCKE